MHKAPATHTIFGAGQVGLHLAEVLLAQGLQVRIVRRGPAGPSRPGLTWLRGDLHDPSFAAAACEGAQVVYNCVNPKNYYDWEETLRPMFYAVQAAATKAGARLVVLDCLYAYGPSQQGAMHEDTPMMPASRKGELRKEVAETLLAAFASGELRGCIVRASDYFGPGAVNAVVSNSRTLQRLRAGKAVEVFGDPDKRHSFTYTPDVARALACVGTKPRADGRVWHVPSAWQGSTRGLLEAIGERWNRPAKLRRIPTWFLRTAGLLSPLARAMVEMMYQWTEDFVLHGEALTREFGFEPTPADEAVAATAAWIDADYPMLRAA